MNLTFILSMFCIFPAFVGIINWKKLNKKIYPFLFAIFLAVMVEVLVKIGINIESRILMVTTYNLFIILNFLFYLWFLFNHQIIKKTLGLVIAIASILVFAGCYFYNHTWLIVYIFSHVFNKIILVFFAVNILSKQALHSKVPLAKNYLFLIAFGILADGLFFIFLSSLMMLGTDYANLRSSIYSIYNYLNAATYLLFAYAILCHIKIKIYS